MMTHLLLLKIYLSFISLGLPDALLGAARSIMQGRGVCAEAVRRFFLRARQHPAHCLGICR
nr:hypothetical protein [Oscillospiraceae bacterium]